MATVITPDGRRTPVKNLGWLLRHAADVERIEFTTDAPHGTFWTAENYILTATLRDGTRYVTPFASAEVFRQWVQRPSLAHVDVAYGPGVADGLTPTPLPDGYIAAMLDGYITAAFWAETFTDDDGNPVAWDVGPDDLTAEARASMSEDVAGFARDNASDLAGIEPGQAGHDFWLTRNRHGAGFWDRGLGDVGKRLTDASHAYGESDLYVGDDGQVYVS